MNRHLQPSQVPTNIPKGHPYITTISGRNIGPPGIFTASDVCLSDIKVALAKMCRYNGHVNAFYSVAEHSVLVSQIATAMGDAEAEIPALFHDAHEAYMGDIARPQKDMIAGMHDFERDMEGVVHEALGLPAAEDPVWERVKMYDTWILHRELALLRSVMPSWYNPCMEALVPAQVQPVGLEWREAESFFRNRMVDLGISVLTRSTD